MGLLDFFKKKKRIKKEKKRSFVKAPESKEKVKEIKIEKIKPKKKILGDSYGILFSPHITEKATKLTENNYYVFKIFPRANKVEIKKTIESLYGINVTGVKIINVPKKRRRLGRQRGWKKGYKKAIVKIKEGQKIEILPR